MQVAPTPLPSDDQNEIKFNFEIKKEIISKKNNKYFIYLKAETFSELIIKVIKDDEIQKTYSNKFSVEEIKENKYFIQFDDLKEICDELSERIKDKNISLLEETNMLIISIPLPSSKIKEIIFELKENEKSEKETISDLINLVYEQKNEINNLNKKINELLEFKKEISFLLKIYISNLDSLIVDNINDNSILKNWINPNIKIKANLLYRMSRDGPEILTFHKLCDNKGPTLTLFYLKNENKVGFFVDESFDSDSLWKKDPNCFIFNLNQKKKCKNINKDISTFYCGNDCGPSANGLGCNTYKKLDHIYHSVENNHIDKVFENGTKILPSKKGEVEYEVIETEIFQIIKD